MGADPIKLNSIGSSKVTPLLPQPAVTASCVAAKSVDLPDSVGPVTMINPSLVSAALVCLPMARFNGGRRLVFHHAVLDASPEAP